MKPQNPNASGPWYREPWPWILAALPATAVIAGLATVVIAVKNQDGLVAEDYYKQGLAINRVLAREQRAAQLGLSAKLWFRDGRVDVQLHGEGVPPPVLTLRFVHPTRAGEDREVPLARVAGDQYQAEAPALARGHWLVQLEDGARTWRLTSSRWQVGEVLNLGATQTGEAGRRS